MSGGPRSAAAPNDPRSDPGGASAPAWRSFWMGGFEGADHVNGQGVALDMARANGHLDRLDEDYALAASLGIRTLRESIGWRLAEPAPGRFDLERLHRMAQAARRQGVQILWSLMHYGLPADLSLRDDAMIDRFAAFARAVAQALAPYAEEPPVVTPVNEINFLAWAASATDLVWPHRSDVARHGAAAATLSGWALKCRLVRASLAAVAAMREVDPRTRFLHIEPVVHVVPPAGRPDLQPLADRVRDYQWQAWDMIAGRLAPELGGHPGALDLLGLNHYAAGQWEAETQKRVVWHERDPRWRPMDELLAEVWQRYGRPMIVAETSHFGEGRVAWLNDMAAQVQRARRRGVPVGGLTLYPLVDRPDWGDATHWHHSGLVDVLAEPDPGAPDPRPMRRVVHTDYAAAVRRWQTCLPDNPPFEGTTMTHLVVFSHLRWGFVYQRPQHLLSRLSSRFPVLFIEEPRHADGPARLERVPQGPELEVLCPTTPLDEGGFSDDQLELIGPLVARELAARGIDDYVVWFYTPMALPALHGLSPRAVVYDCMDELAAFDGAPRALREREAALMQRADLVLTGGPALYAAKRQMHDNAHCLPSAVDAEHFSPARLDPHSAEALTASRLHRGIAAPRLGFYGVIDERLDLGLVAALADQRPDWHIVMVGPVVKIDPARLPQRRNLHWLGMQPYALLPHLMTHWDVCLMPFALNEATRFISPTKTLEYMAAEKPVVSTPVGDVVALYGELVHVAAGAADFVAACAQALAETPMQRSRRVSQMLATVWRMSWDQTARRIEDLLVGQLGDEPAAPTPAQAEQPLPGQALPRPVGTLHRGQDLGVGPAWPPVALPAAITAVP